MSDARRIELSTAVKRLKLKDNWQGIYELLSPVERPIILSDSELFLCLAAAWNYMRRHELAKNLLLEVEERVFDENDLPTIRRWRILRCAAASSEGDFESAERGLELALQSAERANDEKNLAFIYNNLGVIASSKGELANALTHYSRSLATATQIGFKRGVGLCHYNTGLVLLEFGEALDALPHFEEANDYYSFYGMKAELAFVTAERALLYLALGDLNLAQQLAQSSDELATKQKNIALAVGSKRALGKVFIERCAFDAGIKYLEEASVLAAESHERLAGAVILEDLTFAYQRAGNLDRSGDLQIDAVTAYEELGANARILKFRDRLMREQSFHQS